MSMPFITVDAIPGELFDTAPASELKKVLDEALELVRRVPAILTRISADQDAVAKRKKGQRLADRRWAASLIADLPGLELEQDPAADVAALPLATGRPRMPADLVFLLFTLQGYLGSVTDRQGRDQLRESRTLHSYLRARNLPFPGWTTILENLQAISPETADFILTAQLHQLAADHWDTFDAVIVDSTAVTANTCWPTDPKMLLGLLRRAHGAGQKLASFGLPNLPDRWSRFRLNKLAKLLLRLSLAGGKPGAKRRRKKLYRQFLDTAEKLIRHLVGTVAQRDPVREGTKLPPRRRRLLQQLWAQLEADVAQATQVHDYTAQRMLDGAQRPADQKVLSLTDPAAAFITKGGRDPVIGYKPQVARSPQGFVAGLVVPGGNASDAVQLQPLINDVAQRTGMRPHTVSADDGYASATNRAQLLASGIEHVSFCGAKGKKITPPLEWNDPDAQDLRRQRSAVESLIFVLKHGYGFGRLRRRGIDAVRVELLQKAIAHNFYRVVWLRAAEEHRRKHAA